MLYLYGIFVYLQLLNAVISEFTPDFNNFLVDLYTEPGRKVLERLDFGKSGSFGGKMNSLQIINRKPVLIVHGVTNTAARFEFVRKYLKKNHFSNAEIYGTTYGEGTGAFTIFVKLQCQYVRQIRAMIQAVYVYTQSKIDILAFSMGSPITRKAILGGLCEDDFIGKPLTHMVETFVSVAGANYGSSLCFVPFWVCSKRNGLHCKSKFLQEINNQTSRYEGRFSYSIYSDSDDKVGVDCCGNKCSSLPHSNDEFQLKGFDHDQVMEASLKLQLNLIQQQNTTA
ncbi:unnamed protein product [Auanema sp. JU1783]|nr:unnamed protein product [Auanema sp. JU1783]